MAEESAVKVCVRVRPFIEREESDSSEPVEVFWEAKENIVRQLDDRTSTKSFAFDRVFTAEGTTNQLYQDIAKPLVVSTVEGYNGTIFAYGQTASGKTFTMMGSDMNPGIIPLAVDDVFRTIKKCPKKEFLLRVSYMEIYNETVTDLLVDSWKRKPLEVRETINKNIYVADLTEELVTSPAQALAWIRKGEKNRHYGSTKMNHRSSRSHAIFRMILESRERTDLASGENADGAIIVSHLNLVDLAGSERTSQTRAEGARLKEGCNINSSLFTLGQVIKKLSEESQRNFINYRDSKLTRILQNSLGGNAKTVILCMITTASLDETLGTLQFASAAKKMKNDPHVTEVSDDGALLKRYRNEIVDLKKRLQEVSSVTQTTATEKEELFQILQEKQQLQLEQEDRIRNLTELLVTSNNMTSVQLVPKRRVTWGGKMLRHPMLPIPGTDLPYDSFSESICPRTNAYPSSMEKITEGEFFSNWTFPDEPEPDDTKSCEDFVTLRSSENRVAELELQLQSMDQEKRKALDQIEAMNQEAAEVNLKLQSEAEEKEILASEREYLLQQLDVLRTDAVRKEEEATGLSQKLQEKLELEEFHCLEKMCAKECEIELQNEISLLKNLMDSRELQILELKNNLDMVSKELKDKTQVADDLQNMCGKDLVEEVANLRHSLDDAQHFGKETKKEWALLRSENIALEEMKMTLTTSDEKMKAEVDSLRKQLETEKSKFKKMQTDLQKELNVVFNENAKLFALCDGKLPKNIMDSVELEMTVTKLKKELEASQQAEGLLSTRLEELGSLQADQNELNNLEKISAEELEKLELAITTITAERDQLKMDLQENIDMVIENQEDLRNSLGEIAALKQRVKQLVGATVNVEELRTQSEQLEETLQVVSEQKKQLEVELQQFVAEAAENESLLHSLRSQLQEQVLRNNDIESTDQEYRAQLQNQTLKCEQLEATLQTACEEKKQLEAELQQFIDKAAENENLLHSLETRLQEQVQRNNDVESPDQEYQAQLQNQTFKCEQLEATLQMACEEKKQLEAELQQFVDKAAENEDLLRSLETQLQEQVQRNNDIESPDHEYQAQLQNQTLKCEQLEATLQTACEEKKQLEAELQQFIDKAAENENLLHSLETQLQEQVQRNNDIESTDQEYQARLQNQTFKCEQLEASLQMAFEEKKQLEAELQQFIDKAAENENLLHSLETRLQEQILRNNDVESTEQIKSIKPSCKISSFNTVEMLYFAVDFVLYNTLKCEQLEATLQTACEEKKQLEAELQQFIDKAAENENLLHSLETQLQEQVQRNNDIESTEQEYQAQLQNQTLKCEQLEATLQTACEEKKQLEAELQQFIDKAAENENLLHSLENQLLEQVQRNKDVESTDQEYQARLQNQTFKCEQLEATLQTACEEKKQLEAELQQFIDKAAGNENLLHSLEIQLQEQILRNNDVESTGQEIKTQLQNEVEDSKILLDSLQSEIRELKNKSCEMAKVSEEKELHLNQDIQFLRMELEAVKEEKERFAMEKLTEHRASMEEIQKLRGKMTSLGEEKDKILDNLEELSQEKSELNAQLEDKIEMVITLKEKLDHVENVQLSEKNSTLEQLTCSMSTLSEERAQLQKKIEELVIEKEHLKSELQDVMGSTQEHTNEKETQLQQEVQQLEELKIEERHAKVQAEAKTSEGLIEAKAFTSSLDENNLNCVQKLPNVTASSGLEMSSLQLQEIFGRFEHFIHTCSSDHPIIRDKILTKECFLNESDAFPQATLKAHGMVIGFGPQNLTLLSHYIGTLLGWARIHKGAFQKLVEDDFSIFEKGRWLDLLRGSSQALSCSVQDLEADPGQGHSLSELLTKRQVYVQKMENTLRCLWAGLDSYREELKAEVKERERFSAQVQEELNKVPLVMSGLDSLFRAESVWRSGVKERRIKFLRGMLDERVAQRQELQQLKSKAECQLQRVKTVRAILQQTLEDTQLEDLFARFEQFIDTCSSAHPMTKDKMLTMECFLNESDPFPHATLKAHSIVIGFGPRNLRPLFHIIRILPQWARLQKMTFQKLVENDVAIFEEGRLQDLLRCRSQAISCSVQDLDADPGQGHRLNELLKRRQLYVQKMENTLRYLWASLDSYRDELSTEVHERARFSTQVQQELNRVPLVMSRLDKLFQDESVWRSGVEEKRNKFLQGIIDERVAQHQELQQLKSQAECQLQRVKNMCAILQQTLEDTPTGSEQTLVGDNQHLIQLRQSEEEVKVLCAKIKQLEEDLVQANDSDSKSKMATQELQTMLLTNQAQVEELKNVIKDLMTQLETPEAAELQKVQAQLFKMEMELRAAVDEHQKEMERKNMVLHMKEESIRKLKESLRKLQQPGEVSFRQGEELAERLLNPRGLGSKSNVVQSGMEEESVKQIQVKVTQWETVISNQQAEVDKWRNRAIKMKYKSKAGVETSFPSTPTKRGLPPNTRVLLQSPQKFVLESPKLHLDSPKLPPMSPIKTFFGDDRYSEMKAQTRSGLFFDNSNLGLTSDGKLSESSPKPNECVSQ
ncbi:centromere-associated protein E [Stigmatopora nigra]